MVQRVTIRAFTWRARLCLIALLLVTLLVPAAQAAEPETTSFVEPMTELQSVPEALVSGEPIDGFTLAAPRLFWWNRAICIAGGPGGALSELIPPVTELSEAISRIATYGGDMRRLFYRSAAQVGGNCGSQNIQFSPRSNLIADDTYVYWLSSAGLVRLSVEANPGDQPELLNNEFIANGGSELVQNDEAIFALFRTGAENQSAVIRRFAKSDGALTNLASYPVGGPAVRRIGLDDQYLYWLIGNNMRRYDFAAGASISLTDDVTGYYPEGTRTHCTLPSTCVTFSQVFVAKGRQIYRYINDTETLSSVIYTSPDSNATISEIVGDQSRLFFFERRPSGCEPTCAATSVLIRTTRFGGDAVSLYVGDSSAVSRPLGLVTDGQFLFWNLAGLQRLPNDAEALPVVDMEITGIEVTQGVQRLDNSVPLVAGRRTFVRVHVRSKQAGVSVPGVTARLLRVGATQFDSGLVPINPVGPAITVFSSPNRDSINQSFLFELPWSWTTGSFTLQARLNPLQFPLEPSYGADNQRNINISYVPSPRLEVEFVSWAYTLNGVTYAPRPADDIEQTYSWIRRVYPVASAPGFADDPSPGFRPALRTIEDAALGSLVDQSSTECDDLMGENEEGEFVDYRNLCASRYTNTAMAALHDVEGISSDVLMYGMISDAAGFFPRGQASGNVSSGPVGIPGDVANFQWDDDSSYGDWYAGHEIGHTAGRGHPGTGQCGHGLADENYPYEYAKIGPADGTVTGFDAGDPAFDIAPAVLPDDQWTDMMSYCNNQWISDYTYNGIYNRLIANLNATLATVTPAPAATGDLLAVYGTIATMSGKGRIIRLARVPSVAAVPELRPGSHAIRLRSAAGATLAEYRFSPDEADDSGEELLGFGQVVRFVAGTTAVQIVRVSDGAIVAEQAVSPSVPSFTGGVSVAVGNVTGDGQAVLSWQAVDPDGDSLTFNIFTSRDGGKTLEPLRLNVTGSSTTLDTGNLPGGPTIFRVVASDGVHTAQADSREVILANKVPQPRILSPGDGDVFHYGQLINFSGTAFDLQDGTLPAASLVWSNQKGELGLGSQLSLNDLPVGVNVITLSAKNSAGLTAEATITIVIKDDLKLPGPTLDVSPGRLGWHVGAGTTAVQTAEVDVANAGGGELTWTARVETSSPQFVLSVGPAPGTAAIAPARFIVSANPAGVPAGSVLQGELVVEGFHDGVSVGSVRVPMHLAVGNLLTATPRENPPAPSQHRIYLPLVRR